MWGQPPPALTGNLRTTSSLISRLDKPRPPEQYLCRRTKSEYASAAPVDEPQPRRSLKSLEESICLPQWFPLRRPWAALLSLTTKQFRKCLHLSAPLVEARRKPRNPPSPAFCNQPLKISNQKFHPHASPPLRNSTFVPRPRWLQAASPPSTP